VNDAQPPPVVPGQVIGERYRVGTLIGRGGMGVVCAATHVGLDVAVAIKFIRTDLKDSSEFVQRFLNEARRAAVLKSEHIARVHDVGQLESGDLYLVMERLDGCSLDAHIREQGPLPPAVAVNLVLQACDGLSEAHAAGIVHRDIKPENLFLARRGDGKHTLKILDFGISKQTTDDAPSSLTNSNRSLGSPWYMSPEQMVDTSSVDHRADIWSLGVVLFELLTGTRPFDGGSIPEVCAGVLTVPTPTPRQRRPEIQPELEAIVLRCLEKNPDHRYANVSALVADLKPWAAPADAAADALDAPAEEAFFSAHDDASDRERVSSLPPSSPRRRGSSRRVVVARTLGVLGILGSLALIGWAFGGGSTETAAQRPLEELHLPGGTTRAPAAPPASLERAPLPDPPPSPESASSAPEREPAQQSGAGRKSLAENEASGAPGAPAPALRTPAAAPTPPLERRPRATGAPALTQEEIRRRKERYERWLREQGLQRVGEVVVPVPSDPPTDPNRSPPVESP
jgi:serine/threonine-protein kinase